MNKELLKEYILGELTLEFVLAFYLFAIIGMLASMLLHYDRRRKKSKKSNIFVKFSSAYWVKDNIVRMLTNVIVIFIVIRFYNELPINIDLNMFLGLAVGMSIDLVIIFLRKYTVINIFQSKVEGNNKTE